MITVGWRTLAGSDQHPGNTGYRILKILMCRAGQSDLPKSQWLKGAGVRVSHFTAGLNFGNSRLLELVKTVRFKDTKNSTIITPQKISGCSSFVRPNKRKIKLFGLLRGFCSSSAGFHGPLGGAGGGILVQCFTFRPKVMAHDFLQGLNTEPFHFFRNLTRNYLMRVSSSGLKGGRINGYGCRDGVILPVQR